EKVFSEQKTAKYIQSLADALLYCHKKNVIHRDIKPENLLIGHKGVFMKKNKLAQNNFVYFCCYRCKKKKKKKRNLKIGDFGWSVHHPVPDIRRTTLCGTLDYLPPEIVEGKRHDANVDNWSLGVLAYEFLVGKPPFEAQGYRDTYRKISKVELAFPSHVSPAAREFITKLLQKDPSKRLSLEDVLKHPFILDNTAHP
ncbi:hypothetical protein RFI_12104, partial [Reticulomyxa filosa]